MTITGIIGDVITLDVESLVAAIPKCWASDDYHRKLFSVRQDFVKIVSQMSDIFSFLWTVKSVQSEHGR